MHNHRLAQVGPSCWLHINSQVTRWGSPTLPLSDKCSIPKCPVSWGGRHKILKWDPVFKYTLSLFTRIYDDLFFLNWTSVPHFRLLSATFMRGEGLVKQGAATCGWGKWGGGESEKETRLPVGIPRGKILDSLPRRLAIRRNTERRRCINGSQAPMSSAVISLVLSLPS